MREKNLSAVELAQDFCTGRQSASKIIQAALEAAHNDQTGAFWHILDDRALTRAQKLDTEHGHNKDLGPLAGVPFVAKDCFDIACVPTSCGIKDLADLGIPEQDSKAISLLEEAGAILIGKTSMDQLAWGMKGEALGFPRIKNPAAPTRMAGGSSGGSAAAVANGIVPIALGTDAGGSIRQPASWCGVVGFKPTLGAISVSGCMPMAPSLDTIGVISRTVTDQQLTARALNIELKGESIDSLKVGVLTNAFNDAESETKKACEEALEQWRESGAILKEIELPWTRRGLSKIYAAELAASWLGIIDSNDIRLLPKVREGLEYGAKVSTPTYIKTIQQLHRIRAEAREEFRGIDIVAGPTSPIAAQPLADPDPTKLAGRNTRVFNGLGWPAISIPLHTDSYPVGIQLASLPGQDKQLLQSAQSLVGLLNL